MSELDPGYIRESLRRLARLQPKIFGADAHGFILNPRLREIEVAAFEEKHRISLPADYRHFITEIGNGGAGPYYGVFPLGYMDDAFDVAPWDKS